MGDNRYITGDVPDGTSGHSLDSGRRSVSQTGWCLVLSWALSSHCYCVMTAQPSHLLYCLDQQHCVHDTAQGDFWAESSQWKPCTSEEGLHPGSCRCFALET